VGRTQQTTQKLRHRLRLSIGSTYAFFPGAAVLPFFCLISGVLLALGGFVQRRLPCVG
jgi:hypothetical protein